MQDVVGERSGHEGRPLHFEPERLKEAARVAGGCQRNILHQGLVLWAQLDVDVAVGAALGGPDVQGGAAAVLCARVEHRDDGVVVRVHVPVLVAGEGQGNAVDSHDVVEVGLELQLELSDPEHAEPRDGAVGGAEVAQRAGLLQLR